VAKGTKLVRAAGWAAGVGVSNWILQRRRAIPNKEAQVPVPAASNDLDVEAEIYRLRGETVSVGGMVELLIATLARRFAGSKKKRSRAQWKDLKGYLKSTDLQKGLQDELAGVNRYFKPHNLAAHTAMILTGVADATQILRLDRAKRGFRVESVSLDELEEEVVIAQGASEAIRAIGRTLADHQPEVLADMDDLTKAVLLGST
jgi:hypothetical protein